MAEAGIEARALRIVGKGDVDVLQVGSLRVRDPGPGEIRVRIAAAGLNRADVLQRKGHYPAPKGVVADVPGLEYAGTIEAVGEGVQEWKGGERVMGIVAGGAMATHVVVHAREALLVPDGITLQNAAAIPEVFLTAYDALFVQGALRMGDTVIVHSIGSGVGTATLQLALAAGARVIGTSRTQDKLERARKLGLQESMLIADKTFASLFMQEYPGVFANLIVDTVGGAYLGDNVKLLATSGKLVVLGLLGGASAELSLGLLLAKRASVIGSVLRSRPLEEKIALVQAFAHACMPAFALQRLVPVVDRVLPMSEAAQAHTMMEGNDTFGKIVLTWD
jgi:NADPH2:quinone reductase